MNEKKRPFHVTLFVTKQTNGSFKYHGTIVLNDNLHFSKGGISREKDYEDKSQMLEILTRAAPNNPIETFKGVLQSHGGAYERLLLTNEQATLLGWDVHSE